MVHRADHAADRVEDDLEIDESRRGAFRHQPEEHEHVGDRHGGEDLEEVFDPQMHDPEAPEVDHGEVRLRPEEHTHAVEQRNRERGVEEQPGQAAAMLTAQRDGEPAEDDHQPQDEAGGERDLPEPSEIEILPALGAEPPRGGGR